MSKKSAGNATIPTYYAGFLFVLGHGPWDKVTNIIVSEKEAWNGVCTGGQIDIEAPDLFGGTSREGGITGLVDIMMGYLSQVKNDYLDSKYGPDIPAYRGLTTAILRGCCLGTNYYFKPWWFRGTRIRKVRHGAVQWQDSLAEVGPGLINAVHVVRECFTDGVWGMGLSGTECDETSFLAAAQTCHDEGLGFSWYWDKEEPIQDFIDNVMTHIQGHVYRDRVLNKFVIKLTRKLSSTAGLPVLDVTNVKSISGFKRKTIRDLSYSVTVKFLNNATDKDDSVTVSDLSLFQRQLGGGKTTTTTYDGVATKDVAIKLANRDQWQLAVPVFTCSIECAGSIPENLYPGDAFVLNHPDAVENVDLIMRVLTIDLGDPKSRTITIETTQDFFSATMDIYDTPPETDWVSPINNPTAVANRIFQEMPYYLVAVYKGDAFAQAVASTDSYIMVAGSSPTPDSISAGIWTHAGGSYVRYGKMDFCFSAVLSADITKQSTNIPITGIINDSLLSLNTFIQLGSECMEVTAKNLTAGVLTSLTVVRGVMDTVPEVHLTGDRLYGVEDFFGTDLRTYITGESVYAKLTTITPKGELTLASAPEDTLVIANRLQRPYPPANVKINGAYWPASVNVSPFTVSFATRNRIQETTGFVGFYSTDVTTEVGVTYSWDLKRTDTMAVLASGSGVTASPISITPGYIGNVILTIWSVRDGLDSFQKVTHTFDLV